MKNAVIYARFSSHGQNEQTIDGQINICREYAERSGLTVIKVYEEKARTGTNDQRPAFQEMIRDAMSDNFQYIIVYMLDRFARNRRDSIMYKEMLKQEHGIRVLSATQQISDDEGGELYEMFTEWNDEKYSKRLSKRVHNGLDISVANGTFTGGQLLYGYKLVDTDRKGKSGIIHRVVIDEPKAAIIRFVFTEYAKGATKREIADMLNAKGERFNGKPFHFRSFDNWLLNRKYTGKFHLGIRPCDNQYPPIVEQGIFDKVQERLHKNRHKAGTKHAIEPYLLTGKAFCGICHAPMTADNGTSRDGTRHYYYVCNHKRKGKCEKTREDKDFLEQYVTEQVRNFLIDPDNADYAATSAVAFYEKRTGDDGLRSIETKITQTQQAVEKYTVAFVETDNQLLKLNIEKKMKEYEQLLIDLEKQRAQILLERGNHVTKQQILKFIAELVQGDPADKDYQQQIIDNLVLWVEVDNDTITPYFVFGAGKNYEHTRLKDVQDYMTYVFENKHLCSASGDTKATIMGNLLARFNLSGDGRHLYCHWRHGFFSQY